LITALASVSGYPRSACLRFARKMGLKDKRFYREWSEREIGDLKRLHNNNSPMMIARKLKRTVDSVRTQLKRLGMNARVEADRFTKYTLALLLHVRPQVVQDWIDREWLKFHREGTDRLPRVIIMAVDFIQFCERHPQAVLGRRVNQARLDFLVKFAYPADHAYLLKARKRKKKTKGVPSLSKHRGKVHLPAGDVDFRATPDALKRANGDHGNAKAARAS
jgi:hypothetical protein